MLRVRDVLLALFDMRLENDIIFLDYNSTTPVDSNVLEAMIPYLTNNFANPSSAHNPGKIIQQKVEDARERVAYFINAEPEEIIFTSGATEAINIALKGVADCYSGKGRHIITISTEHKAVLDTCKELEDQGFEVTYLPVQNSGLIDLDMLQQVIRPDTILISAMFVNNETGIIQHIKEIAKLAHEQGALFMTDATQAAGKIEIDVDYFDIDLLCMSGHKMYAPKGIGVLYVRQRNKRVKLSTFLHGGGHEKGIRSGTLNVPGIIALAKACEIAQSEMKRVRANVGALRDQLENNLLKVPMAYVIGDKTKRIANVSNMCFPQINASILIGEMKNIAVSNGSACSAAIIEPSHVLRAMGLSTDDAFASIRLSLGKYNTQEEIIFVSQIVSDLISKQLRNA